jgi:uncharacterized repeat protein (TIGR02543 family)
VDADEIKTDTVGGDPETGDTYYIFANHLTLTTDEAQAILAGGDSALIAAAAAGARKAEPNGKLTVKPVAVTENGLKTIQGNYKVTFAVDEARTVFVTVKADVVKGDPPIISVTSPLVIPVSKTPGEITDAKLREGVSATDAIDGDLTSAVTYPNPHIDGTVAQVVQVTYSVTDSEGNTVSDSRSVIVDDGRYEWDDKYILGAASFVIAAGEVDLADKNAQILKKSNAEAYSIKGAPATPYVNENGGYTNTKGDYQIKIGIAEYSSLSSNVTAKVYDEEVTTGTNGQTYSILASDFRINLKDAAALIAAGKGTDTYINTFITRANAKAYLRTDNLSVASSVELYNDGGFAVNDGSVFKVVFNVKDEPNTRVTVNVLVSNATPPKLYVPAYKTISVGGIFGEAEYMDGVYATDNEDDNAKLVITHNSPVVNTVAGLYTVTYSVTDSDNNTTTKTGIVDVNDGTTEYKNGFLVKARTFVKKLSDVNGGDAEIKTFSNAEAWDVRDGNLNKPVPAIVASDGGYKKAEGKYSIRISTADPAGIVTDLPVRNIKGIVVTKDVLEEGIVTDGSGNDAIYDIGANNVTVRKSQAQDILDGKDAALIDAAKAEAWKILPEDVETKDVVVSSWGTFTTAAQGNYKVTFAVKEAPSVKVEVSVNVNEGHIPVITVDGILEFQTTATSNVLTRAQLINRVKAEDPGEDGDITDKIVITLFDLDRKAVANIDTVKAGLYRAVYNVTDRDGDAAIEKSRTVVVNDGRYIVDPVDKTVIGAKGYMIKKADVRGTDGEILTNSFAEATDFDGNRINPIVVNKGAYAAGVNKGEYPIVLGISGKANRATIVATVTDNDVVNPPNKDAKYGIGANNIRINVTDANKIANVAALTAELLKRSEYSIAKLIPGTPSSTATIASLGGMDASLGKYVQNNSFKVRLAVTAEPTTYVDITVLISDGAAPTLTVKTPIVVTQGQTYNPMADVKATDYEDDLLGIPLKITYKAVGAAVDVNKVGAYRVQYSVTDSDYNTATAYRVVVVSDGNFTVTDKYILYAVPFKDSVMNIKGTNAEILARTGAYAIEIATFENVDVTVLNSGQYAKKGGTYKITLAVVKDTSVHRSVTATISAKTFKVTFDANGGVLSGVASLNVVQPTSKVAYLPATPTKEGYTFVRWNTQANGKGKTFTASTAVTASTRVYAIWKALPEPVTPKPTPPTTPPTPPATVVNNYYPATVSYVPVSYPVYVPTASPAPTVTPEPPVIVSEPPVITPEPPVEEIADAPAPKTPADPSGWALLNLILSVLSAIVAVWMLVVYFMRRKNEADETYEDRHKKSFGIFRLVSLLAAAISIVVLFLTETFTGPMAIVDEFTILMALIAVIQVLSLFLNVTFGKEDRIVE